MALRIAAMNVLQIVGIAAVVLLLAGFALYNSLVRARNTVDESWSGIDVQLRRRHDLVPNLVNTVRGYAGHEAQTLDAVTTARNGALQAGHPAAIAPAEDLLTGTLMQLLGVIEAYPDLKADQNFLRLQAELAELEDQIAASRRIYNGNVESFNTKMQSFPGNIVARPAGFTAREFFEAGSHARVPSPVNFG